MHARWLPLVFLPTLLASCGPALDQFALGLTAAPKTIRDDGTPVTLTANAFDDMSMPGKGSVRFQSTAGSLTTGATAQLDESGNASVDFSCNLKEDPGCADMVTVTASWLVQGKILQATLMINVTVTDARQSACAPQNLRQLTFPASATADLQLGLGDEMLQTHTLGLGSAEKGVAVYHPTQHVALLAVSLPSASSSVSDEEKRIRDLIVTTGSVSNPLVKTFTTWDNQPATRTTLDLAGTDTLQVRVDALGMKIAGVSSGLATATTKGPYKVLMSVVVRGGGVKTEVLLAVTPATGFTDSVARTMDDMAGGSSLAHSASTVSMSQCETFTVNKVGKADLIWVVDDSGSMAASQAAVAAVGSQLGNRLRSAAIDLRFAGVSTGYYDPDYQGSERDWTPDTSAMLKWFSGSTAWGTDGSGIEEGFAGLQSFVTAASPPAAPVVPGPVRPDADVHVLFLSDAPEQSALSPLDVIDLFQAHFPNQRVVAHGIVCPESAPAPAKPNDCGDGTPELQVGKYHSLIRMTGGVLASIRTFNTTPVTGSLAQQQADVMAAVVRSVISGGGFALQHTPVTASLRVATSATVGMCDNTDIPRDDDNGWQIDPTNGKLSFAGNCTPPVGSTVAVSYVYWQ